MRVVHKHLLKKVPEQTLIIPRHFKVVHTGIDTVENYCIWIEMDYDDRCISVPIYTVYDGQPVPEKAREHVGTFIRGTFVCHIYI